tara:strand:- start:14164 stop:14802 length:639 start_codon:yes stop_codon:yes gene_type:complete
MKQNENIFKSKGLLIKIIETSLRFWIRRSCTSVSELKFSINETTQSLLKGNISNIKTFAKKVVFQGLIIDEIELVASNIKIDFKSLPTKLSFKEEFKVNFNIKTSDVSLTKTLLSKKWKWLGELLCRELLGTDSLTKLTISESYLELNGIVKSLKSTEKSTFRLIADTGKIVLFNKINSNKFTIPMENSVFIDKAFLDNNSILISGKAKIKS